MSKIRFYAADLAAYNNGILHGVWVDASTSTDEMQDEINAMLRKSPCPNVMVEDPETGKQVPTAEEWAMHDMEGLPSYFGEYIGLHAIAEYMELSEEYPEIDNDNLRAIVSDYGSVTDTKTALEDNFCGIYDSFKDYAEEQIAYYGKSKETEWLTRYFDYDSFARDLKLDMHTIELPSGDIAVFHA